MKFSFFGTVIAGIVLVAPSGEGAQVLRKRELHTAEAHNDTTYANGTQALDGGHLLRDPADTAENPASIIWTGAGNKPNANSPQSDLGTDLTCFSGLSVVQTQEGIVAMKDLRVGDEVLVGNGNFEGVYAFAHRNPNRKAEFVAISLSPSSQVLELTNPHLVFLEQHDNPIRADAVKVGDVLRGGEHVTNIGSVERTGIFAPLTPSGTVVASGVVSSNYVALRESSLLKLWGKTTPVSFHDYIHLGLSPFRLYCGLSDKLCQSYNDDGMPPYVLFSIWLSRWVFSQNVVLQFLYMAAFLVVTSLCSLLEAPRFLMTVATVLYLVLRRNRTKSCLA